MYFWLMKMKLLALLSLLIAGIAFVPHPNHVAITEMVFNSHLNRFECTMQIHSEDLELVLRKRFSQGVLNVGAKEERQWVVDSLSAVYLEKSFFVWVNQNPSEFQFIGREGDMDDQYLHFTMSNSQLPKEIKIENTSFMDYIKGQVNVHYVQMKDCKHDLICNAQSKVVNKNLECPED